MYRISGLSSAGLTKCDLRELVFWSEIQVEPLGEISQLLFVQLLLLMRDVLAFACLAEPVTFYSFGQNDSGLPCMLDGALVRVVDLQRIVAAAAQPGNLIVASCLRPAPAAPDIYRKTLCGRMRRRAP